MAIRTWTLAALLAGFCGACNAQSVVTYHNSLTRHGEYVVPGLTLSAAAGMTSRREIQAEIEWTHLRPAVVLASGWIQERRTHRRNGIQ